MSLALVVAIELGVHSMNNGVLLPISDSVELDILPSSSRAREISVRISVAQIQLRNVVRRLEVLAEPLSFNKASEVQSHIFRQIGIAS